MGEPASKAGLIERIERDYAQLSAAVAQLGAAQIERASPADGWSVKDILAHLTFWHDRMAALVEGVLRGEPPTSLRQPGEDGDAATDRVNAEHYAANKSRPLPEVRAKLDRSYARVLAALAALSDADLAGDSALSALLGGPLLELIAGDTYGHYEEHLPAVRAAGA